MIKTIVLRQDPPFYKKTGDLHVPPFPHHKRWCLVCIALTLSPCAISPATQASCTPNMKVSTQILRPINFVHLANQTGGILHSPPTPTQGGSSSSTLVMTTSLSTKFTKRLLVSRVQNRLALCSV